MHVVEGIDGLRPDLGPVFVVVGVFDGMHLGHAYLLEHLVAEARTRDARPTVITFDHHPDEVLRGTAPALLLDAGERLERLAAAGVEVTVVQHFDETLRQTPYDAFVERIRARVRLSGILMTPDAAFGYERRGTPASLAALGERDGFDVVVVPPFTLDGQDVRSSAIRAAIVAGDLAGAARLLGRPVTITGAVAGTPDGRSRLDFALPVALPPDGEYAVRVDGEATTLTVQRRRRPSDRQLPGDAPRHRRSLSGSGSAAEDLRSSVGVPRPAGGLVDAIAGLPRRLAGLVVTLAAGLAPVVPRSGRLGSGGRRRPLGERTADPVEQGHQVPGLQSGSETPASWFS